MKITLSDGLKAVLATYTTARPRPKTGLCMFVTTAMPDWRDADDLSRELEAAFKVCGLDSTAPFNDGDFRAYLDEGRKDRRKNKQRAMFLERAANDTLHLYVMER